MQEPNLLAPERKERLRLDFVFELIRNVSVLTWLITVTVLATLGGGWYVVHLQRIDAESRLTIERSTTEGNRTTSLAATIHNLNTEMAALDRIQQTYMPWTKLLNALASRVPLGVRLTTLSIDRSTRILSLQGHADDRSDFLVLVDQLKSTPAFAAFDAPLVTKRTDIPFNLTITVDLATLP